MPEILSTDDYFYPITQSEQYIEYKDRAERLEGTQTQEEVERSHTRAIAMGARALAQLEFGTSSEQTANGAMFDLISQLDAYTKAEIALEHRKLDKEHTNAYKRDAITFNHALKEVIIKTSDTNPSSLLQTLSEAYARMKGSKNVQVFMGHARAAIVGMQHELAVGQIIDATSGYEVAHDRSIGIEDELHGVDIYVRDLSSGQVFGIDVKSNKQDAERARLNSSHPDSIVASPLSNSQLENSFTLKRGLARSLSHGMKYALDRAARTATETMAYAA